jgi:2-dehydro-3-deoxygluconokinase
MSMRVVCIGECMVEFLRQENGLWRQGFAGDSLNVAWAMRALLPDSVQIDYLTRVGSDSLSDDMVHMLQRTDIGTQWITRDERRTVGLYTIQTDDTGERSFSYWRSDSAARGLAQDGAVLKAALHGADLVYLSGITLAILPAHDRNRLLDALGFSGARPFRVAFDPNIRPRLWESIDMAAREVTAMASRADLFLPTHEDEANTFGDADSSATLDRYAGLGVSEIVVKDGIRPTLLLAGAYKDSFAVAAAEEIVDTTGAGDSFNGAYLAASLMGFDKAAAIRKAQAVSALVIGQRGALIAPNQLRDAFQAISERPTTPV